MPGAASQRWELLRHNLLWRNLWLWYGLPRGCGSRVRNLLALNQGKMFAVPRGPGNVAVDKPPLRSQSPLSTSLCSTNGAVLTPSARSRSNFWQLIPSSHRSRLAGDCVSLRMESPRISMRWALCTKGSRMPSARGRSLLRIAQSLTSVPTSPTRESFAIP